VSEHVGKPADRQTLEKENDAAVGYVPILAQCQFVIYCQRGDTMRNLSKHTSDVENRIVDDRDRDELPMIGTTGY
jgi:hypothetical protein